MTILKTREELTDLIYENVKSHYSPSKNWIWVDHFADESGKVHFLHQINTDEEIKIDKKEKFATKKDLKIWIEDLSDEIMNKLNSSDFVHSIQQAMH